jgi:hypothetical protein
MRRAAARVLSIDHVEFFSRIVRSLIKEAVMAKWYEADRALI